jgi:hypothetical protein
MFSSVASHPLVAWDPPPTDGSPSAAREQRIVRTFVAAEEAAHDPRALGPPPPSSYTIGSGVDGERTRHVGLAASRARSTDVRVALREHDQVSLAQTDRFSPTACPQHGAARDQVVFDDALAPGITVPAISRDGGASATHGELSSKSKYTAPVRRTARSTSERTSAVMPALVGSDARHPVRTPGRSRHLRRAARQIGRLRMALTDLSRK